MQQETSLGVEPGSVRLQFALDKPFEENVYSLLNLKAPGTKRELANLHSTFLQKRHIK